MVVKRVLRLLAFLGVGYVIAQVGRAWGWIEYENGDSPLSQAAPPDRLRDFSRSILYASSSLEGLYPLPFESVSHYDKHDELAIVYGLTKSDEIDELPSSVSNASDLVYRVHGSITVTDSDDKDDMFTTTFTTANGAVLEAYGSEENFDDDVVTIVSEVGQYTRDAVVGFVEVQSSPDDENGSVPVHFHALVSS